MATQEALPSRKHLPLGGARAINTPEVERFIKETMADDFMKHVRNPAIVPQFLEQYHAWIQSTSQNYMSGLDKFKYKSYTNGTTETFDKWYLTHRNRRLRVFRGEYMYHLATYRNNNMPIAPLEDEPLDLNDHVIISMPFADSGNVRYETENVLDTAAVLGVPVLIDAAYLGLTEDIEFDFSHPAIHSVALSLSKTFPVAHARIGMRLSKFDNDDGIDILRKTEYENRWGAALGLKLIDKFDLDYNTDLYKNIQLVTCQELQITPSNTVLFGLGDSKWEEYNRGGLYNRLFLGGIYEQVNG